MKKLSLFWIVLTLIVIPAYSAGGNFGLGAVVGDPTGITAKLKLSDKNAIDGTVGWRMRGHGTSIVLHANYLFIHRAPFDIDFPNYFLYPGIGARVIAGDHHGGVAARIPLGVGIDIDPVEIFLEIVPLLELIPNTDFDLDIGLGVRFFF